MSVSNLASALRERIRLVALVTALVILALLAGDSQALAACAAVSEGQAAAASGDLDAAEAVARRADADPQCSNQDQTLVRKSAAMIRFNAISRQVGAGAPLNGFRDELEDLRRQSGIWQAYDALAEIARADKDYETAYENYQHALMELSNTTLTPDWMAPDEAYIRRLDKAQTEMRLASAHAALGITRGGCKISYRGVRIAKKTLPVRFEFAKAVMTGEGEAAASDLLACLKLNQEKSILLIGHTDPVGPEDANLVLSEQRARAVADYLYRNGFEGAIASEGRGESEPFAVDDPAAYDTETLNQIFRRVEVEIR